MKYREHAKITLEGVVLAIRMIWDVPPSVITQKVETLAAALEDDGIEDAVIARDLYLLQGAVQARHFMEGLRRMQKRGEIIDLFGGGNVN